jgi:hypothetical protein
LDQLRKVGNWLWRNKEKLVLAGLVIVLIYQVYKVRFAPTEAEREEVIFQPPRGSVPPGEREDFPDPPPALPDRPDTKRLVSSNPFSAEGLGEGGPGADGGPQVDAELLAIRPFSGGTWVAEIRTQTERPKRFGVGEGFESFKVISIDPAEQKVVIYSEEHRREFTLTPVEE